MKFVYTRRFQKDYRSLPARTRKTADDKLRLLASDIRHPSLRVKKVRRFEGIFEASINKNYRILFLLTNEACILLRIGTHDILEK